MCSKKTKDINFKAFHMITNKNEAKTMVKHISCDCKCIFNNTKCNSNQKWNNETYLYECKNYSTCKKIMESYEMVMKRFCGNDKNLKSIADTSVIACDEIISVIDIVSTKMTNAITTNVPINFDGKNIRYKIDCYILHTVLSVIILLLIITIICYHYAKHR